MSSSLSLGISCLALLISGITAWLTFFRKGKLVMTQPTVVFFGPDGSRFDTKKIKSTYAHCSTVPQREGRYLRAFMSLYTVMNRNRTLTSGYMVRRET